MAQLIESILKYISDNGDVNTLKLAKEFNEDHQKIIGSLKSIQAHGELVIADAVSEKKIELTEEGKLVVENGKLF